jgi:hypothetical protein
VARDRAVVLASRRGCGGSKARSDEASITLSDRHPEMRAVVNFVGGWMGSSCSTSSTINQTLFKRGASDGGPTLWPHGDNDLL